ncbi:MAG: FAD-binding protein [Planctomycetota bacterium]|jgi:succinate dehydrogenase/fumarate reductase flavoprotein subunit
MGTGGEPDRPDDFADTLTAGGCTHGHVALIEGANSLRGFYRLTDLGVPFPHTDVGSHVGYKTDHDPRQRGTSAGPWTSRFMVQKLLVELERYNINIFNRYHMLAVIIADKSACGLLCVEMDKQNQPNHGLVLFNCRNVVAAGGGPGDLYEISVYPKGQMGPYAALFEAGVQAHNLTESQFGLASLDPRWNLSGTYQQVIPRYFSTDQDGNDQQEFLNPWFDSMSTLGTNIFLKGYQWPFDHDKVANQGSSLIDIIVQNEMINKNRRVFMDFRENPRATDGHGLPRKPPGHRRPRRVHP